MQVDVRNLPDVIFEIRREMAKVLHEEAGAEANPVVARRLREVAAGFEAGVSATDRTWARRKKKKGDGQ